MEASQNAEVSVDSVFDLYDITYIGNDTLSLSAYGNQDGPAVIETKVNEIPTTQEINYSTESEESEDLLGPDPLKTLLLFQLKQPRDVE